MWGAGRRVGLNEMARVIVSVHIATKKRPFWRARCKCLRYFKNKILRSEKPPVFSNIRNRLTQRILQRRCRFFTAKNDDGRAKVPLSHPQSSTFTLQKSNYYLPKVQLLRTKKAISCNIYAKPTAKPYIFPRNIPSLSPSIF